MKLNSLISATKKRWPKVEKGKLFGLTNWAPEELTNQICCFNQLNFICFERLNLDLWEVLFQVEVETKSWDKKQMIADKNNETGLFCNTILLYTI